MKPAICPRSPSRRRGAAARALVAAALLGARLLVDLLGPLWDELRAKLCVHECLLLLAEEHEAVRQRLGVADARVRVAEVVEERVGAALQTRRARLGIVDQEPGDEVDGLLGRAGAEDLVPRVRLDLRELELRVIRVHRHELLARRRAEHLDDLDELIHAALPGEDGLPQDQLRRDARGRPDVDDRRVVRGAEDQLWRAVIARADVGDVGLALHQPLRRAEVAELQDVGAAVDQKVLRLDIAVADADSVNVPTRSAHLVRVELYEDLWHRRLHLIVVLHHPVHRVGAVLHDDVEVGLARLVTRGVEGVLQLHHVGVPELLHDLKLAILVALVLEHLLDGHRLASLHNLRLVDDAEGAAAQDTLGVVREGRPLGVAARGMPLRGAALHGLQVVQ
mmetsp:Transcript_27146/g.68916  ORF Transcript_27146/g.68916 Transcript_27146/m.68916 type:complete len:393 (+) Transcript_27146:146-1324(+)